MISFRQCLLSHYFLRSVRPVIVYYLFTVYGQCTTIVRNGNSRKGYWAIAGSGILKTTITNERLVQAGYYSILDRYESLHSCD